MQRSIVLSIALAILSFAQLTTTPADLTPAPARKAAPGLQPRRLDWLAHQIVQLQRPRRVAGFLGYLVYGMQTGNSLVHGVPGQIQKERAVRHWRVPG